MDLQYMGDVQPSPTNRVEERILADIEVARQTAKVEQSNRERRIEANMFLEKETGLGPSTPYVFTDEEVSQVLEWKASGKGIPTLTKSSK